MKQDALVGIVGGGIGGLAAAAALSRRGFAVNVFEQAARLHETGSGIVLPPEGVAALDRVAPGLGHAVRSAGRPYPHTATVPFLGHSGTVFAPDSFVLSGRDPDAPPMVTILRSDLHRLLQTAAAEHGVTVRTSARLAGFTEHGQGVTATFANGDSASVDVLIGADGLRSAVRSGLLGIRPPRYAGYACIRGVVLGFLDCYPDGFQTVAPGVGSVFTAALPSDRQYWNAAVAATEGNWPAKTRHQAHNDLRQLTHDWHDPIPAMIDATDSDRLVVTDVYDRDPLTTWGTDRVTLLGDAAHPTTPTVGQGASMAIEDAALLAELLAAVDVPEALRQYATERGPITANIVLQSRHVAERGGLALPD